VEWGGKDPKPRFYVSRTKVEKKRGGGGGRIKRAHGLDIVEG